MVRSKSGPAILPCVDNSEEKFHAYQERVLYLAFTVECVAFFWSEKMFGFLGLDQFSLSRFSVSVLKDPPVNNLSHFVFLLYLLTLLYVLCFPLTLVLSLSCR